MFWSPKRRHLVAEKTIFGRRKDDIWSPKRRHSVENFFETKVIHRLVVDNLASSLEYLAEG